MGCKHEYFISSQLGKGCCRCRLCRQTFPLSNMVEDLGRKLETALKIIGVHERKIENLTGNSNSVYDSIIMRMNRIESESAEFKRTVMEAVTEEPEESTGDMKLAAAIEEPVPKQKKAKRKKKTKQGSN